MRYAVAKEMELASEDIMKEIQQKKAFICDMDGVIYHGSKILDGVKDFVNWLIENDKKFIFLTNSPERTPHELSMKLERMGLKVSASHFYTSAMATAEFLSTQKPGCTAYVIGEAALTKAMYDKKIYMNDVNPDYVVLGETRTYNFEKLESKYTVVPYADGLEYNLPIGKGVYENVIIGAKEKVYIMTPYFIPDDTFFNLLVNKALSGVEVKIFIPQIPDKNYVYCVSRNNAEKLVGYGVKVFTVNNTFLHAKVVMSENAVSTGSINVDLRSFYQQFENAVYTDSQEFIKQVEKDFIDLESKSTLLDKDNLKSNNFFYKIFAGLLQIFAPLM
jgi:hypothetical protein